MNNEIQTAKISRRAFAVSAIGPAVLSGCETQPLLKSLADGASDVIGSVARSVSSAFNLDPYKEVENTEAMKVKAFKLIDAAQKGNTLAHFLEELQPATARNEAAVARLRKDLQEGKSYDFNELLDIFGSESLPAYQILAAAYSAVGRSSSTPQVKRLGTHRYLLEPGAGLRRTQAGKCMDPRKPAPTKGELLEIRYIHARLHKNLRPVFKALCEQSKTNKNISAQTLTWIIMSAGDPEGYCAGVLNKAYINQLNSIYPNGGLIVQSHHNLNSMIMAKVQKEMDRSLAKLFDKPVGYINRNNQSQIDREVDNQITQLIQEGLKDQGQGQPGYTLIAPNVATRAVGSGTLESSQTIINAGSTPVEVDLTDLYSHPRRNRQSISGVPGDSAVMPASFKEKPTRAQLNELQAQAAKNAAAAKDFANLVKQFILTGVSDVDAILKNAKVNDLIVQKLKNNAGMLSFVRSLGTALPLFGTVLSGYEAYTKKSWLTGEPLSTAEHLLSIAGIFPGAGAIASVAKISTAAGKGVIKPVADKFAQFLTKAANTPHAQAYDTSLLIMSNMSLAKELMTGSNTEKFSSFFNSVSATIKSALD